jgi:hypothetical protein
LAFSSSRDRRGFEITPLGYTWGGEFNDSVTGAALKVNETSNYGVMVDINLVNINQDEESQVELYFSHQATQLKTDSGTFTGNPLFDLDIDYYHLGGTYGADLGKVKPFMVGTFGVTHMVPQGPGLDSLTKFSLSLGGGVKLFATDRIGLRLEGRWFGTLFNGSGSAFCTREPVRSMYRAICFRNSLECGAYHCILSLCSTWIGVSAAGSPLMLDEAFIDRIMRITAGACANTLPLCCRP